MQLYYSGAISDQTPQLDATKSLGGFVSNTLIASGSTNAIFPPISKSDVRNVIVETRLLVIKNTTGATRSGISIWTVRGDYSSLLIAAVGPALNTFNQPVFELIPNGQSQPMQATLTSHEGSGNAITISTLAAGACIGVWIQRNLDLSEFTELDGLPGAPELTREQLIALLEANPPGTPAFDQSTLQISYS